MIKWVEYVVRMGEIRFSYKILVGGPWREDATRKIQT